MAATVETMCKANTPPITLEDFIREQGGMHPEATGRLTSVLVSIQEAAKELSIQIRRAGLNDIFGETGTENIHGEKKKILDDKSNKILVEALIESGHVAVVTSEEMNEPHIIDGEREYAVFMDPLDGSSNIENNGDLGTIFSIHHWKGDLLVPGREQVIAGYSYYGSGTVIVLATGETVEEFTYDPEANEFYRSKSNIKIPQDKPIYSINEGNYSLFDDQTKAYLENIKSSAKYKARYIGTAVADVHRTLTDGGIFLYPADSKSPKGKLRLMYEVNPLGFIIARAGGLAYSGKENPLDIIPEDIHQRAPIVLGSRTQVEEFRKFSGKI